MSLTQTFDNQWFPDLKLPYNKIESQLSNTPRIVQGLNSYVTIGGKLTKRPGTIEVPHTSFNLRIDNLLICETLDTPPRVFILASAFNPNTNYWEMWYIHLSDPVPVWTSMGSYRSIDKSIVAHEMAVSRGLAYIRAVPAAVTGEVLGTVIFDGAQTPPRIEPWGALGPTIPARVVGNITYLTGSVTASATTFNVKSSAGFPGTPFNAQINFETVTVTAVVGTAWTVTRGVNGTVAAPYDAGTSIFEQAWSASTHVVIVTLGWQYSYSWKTITGQYTNRAPVETNPDNLPSTTGPFFNALPQITLQGHTDTTNFPTVAVWRTTDGGGTFYLLEEVANPGAGAFTYTDESLTSAAGQKDPLPDFLLDTAVFAPSLTSNSPPPTVLAPKVVGVDTPVKATPIATYVGRLWYAIGNVLFYSAQEELNTGVPEESWPSGLLGNFIRFSYPIMNVIGTSDALYVFTLQNTYQITGTTRETFAASPLYDSLGAPYGHPRAISRFGGSVVFLSHDLRAIMSYGGVYRPISDQLSTDIVDIINSGATIDIKYWADLEKEWVVVTGQNALVPSKSRQWVYDLKLSKADPQEFTEQAFAQRTNFWNAPWDIQSVSSTSGRIYDNDSERRLVFYVWDPANNVGRLCYIDPTEQTGTDVNPDGSTSGFTFNMVTGLMLNPTGNHINQLRLPKVVPEIDSFYIERTSFCGDTDPDLYYYTDDTWFQPIPVSFPENPARIKQTVGYVQLNYPVYDMGERVALQIVKFQSKELLELLTIDLAYKPDPGPGQGG